MTDEEEYYDIDGGCNVTDEEEYYDIPDPYITRAELIKVTEQALQDLDDCGNDDLAIPPALIDDYRKLARTMTTVLINGWYDKSHECGCLIGTMYHLDKDIDKEAWKHNVSHGETQLGRFFDTRIFDSVLNVRYGIEDIAPIVRVVEQEPTPELVNA